MQRTGDGCGDIADHLDPDVRLGALGRLDQQLRALVRVGGAEERDGQAFTVPSRLSAAADLLPDLGLVRHRLADDVDRLRVVPGREERLAHGVRDAEGSL